MKNEPLTIGDVTVHPGERITLALPTPEIYTCAPIYIPIHIVHGKKAGPVLLICGSIHGDEINGVAIIQKLLKVKSLSSIKGTLIVIPSINIYGMMTLSRDLPDRRDLEGSFPGSETGSFASRLAHFLNLEVFSHITHCIDLHTGEPHLSKFPQVKTDLSQRNSRELAYAFHAPVVVHETSEQGLLWLQYQKLKSIPTIIFETGEALRLDAKGIRIGVQGILRVMRNIGLLPVAKSKSEPRSVKVQSADWQRSHTSGLCEVFAKMGEFVSKNQRIATISDPFGTDMKEDIYAPYDAVIIGCNNLPILNEGEPLLQLAQVREESVEHIEHWDNYGKEEAPQ